MNEQTSTTNTSMPHHTTCSSNNGGHNNLIDSDLLAKLVGGITSTRDKALTLLMIDTGLRAGEVVQLDIDSIDSIEVENLEDAGASGTNSGTCKTEKRASTPGRRFYFTALTADALAAYWAERDGDGSRALFVDKKGTRLCAHSVSHIMHCWCDRLGIQRFPLHHLRRRFAASLIDAGCDLVSLQALLGHSSIETTVRLFVLPYPRLDLMVN